jgi:DNA-binding MarR family transcriptional regulator
VRAEAAIANWLCEAVGLDGAAYLHYTSIVTDQARFATLLSEVARQVVRRRSSQACCGDLTLEQFEALRAVNRSDTPSIGSLSTAMGIDLSTMSRNVSVLERNGYLRRARSAEDGRRVHVKLTPKGRKALTTLQCGERDVLGDVYERIPSEERLNVVRVLESLSACFLKSDEPAACCSPLPAQESVS